MTPEELHGPYTPPKAALETGELDSPRLPRPVRFFVSVLVGDSNVRRSASALFWGFVMYFVATFAGSMFLYTIMFPKEPASPEANFAMSFITQLIASYVAAAKSPAKIVRHAAAVGLPTYLGCATGVMLYWNKTSPWWYIDELLLSMLAAIIAGWLEEARRAIVLRGTGAA